MKNLRNFALAAFALLGFAACQQEEFAPEIKNPTHSVTFVAGAPETKTTATIDGTTVNYAWTEADKDRFTVYENGVAATTVAAKLGDDGKMSMTATFPGNEAPVSPKYQALYNSEVSATQIVPENSYAEVSDVMVSNVLDGTREDIFLFSFKREVAFAKMTLKGLTSGAYVSSVTIKSDKPIAGQYDLKTGTFINTSNVITLNVHNAVSGGNAEVWFTTIPVEEATFTITAKTVNNDETIAATYTKTFTKTITLTRGNVKGFGVAMVKNLPYLSQASFAVFEYGVAIPESAFGAKKYSVAVVGDKLAVANGSTVVLFNKADGAFDRDLQVEGVWAITNDDAGNVLVITGDGAYPTAENPNPAGMTFSVAPASSFTDTNTWVTINTYKNNIYGNEIDNPTVRGNLLKGDAVITMASSGPTTYSVFFQFKDGKLMTASGEESELGQYTDRVSCPEKSDAVYKAKLMAYICVSNKFNEGVLFSGYDGNYSLFYNPSTVRENWTTTGLVYGTWASAISYADIVEFEGKTLYIGLQMTLFPQYAMASAIDVVDITDISAPQHLAEISYSNPAEGVYNTAVLQCEKDGDNLAIYIVDGNQQSIAKLVLQPIK